MLIFRLLIIFSSVRILKTGNIVRLKWSGTITVNMCWQPIIFSRSEMESDMSTLWISYAMSSVSEGKAVNLLHPRDSVFNKPLDCISFFGGISFVNIVKSNKWTLFHYHLIINAKSNLEVFLPEIDGIIRSVYPNGYLENRKDNTEHDHKEYFQDFFVSVMKAS